MKFACWILLLLNIAASEAFIVKFIKGLTSGLTLTEIGVEIGHIIEKCGVYERSLCEDAKEVKRLHQNFQELNLKYSQGLDTLDLYEDLQDKSNELHDRLQNEIETLAITFIKSEVTLVQKTYKHSHLAWEELNVDTLLNMTTDLPKEHRGKRILMTHILLHAGMSGMSVRKFIKFKHVSLRLNKDIKAVKELYIYLKLFRKDTPTNVLPHDIENYKKQYFERRNKLAKELLTTAETKGKTYVFKFIENLSPEKREILRLEKGGVAESYGDVLEVLFKKNPHSEFTETNKEIMQKLKVDPRWDKKYHASFKNRVASYFRVPAKTGIKRIWAYGSKFFKSVGPVFSPLALGMSIGFKITEEKKLKEELEEKKILLKNATLELEEFLQGVTDDVTILRHAIENNIRREFNHTLWLLQNATSLAREMFPDMRLNDTILATSSPHSSVSCSRLGLCGKHVLDVLSLVSARPLPAQELVDIQQLVFTTVAHFSDQLRAASDTLKLLSEVHHKTHLKYSLSQIRRGIKQNCNSTQKSYRFWDQVNRNLTNRCPDYTDKDIACMVAYVLANWGGVQRKALMYNCMNLEKYNVLDLPVTTCLYTPDIIQDHVDDQAKGIVIGLMMADAKMKRKNIKTVLEEQGYTLGKAELKCLIKATKIFVSRRKKG